MATVINGSIGSIVNLDEGQISREIFVNEDIYAQEQEQVFSRKPGSSWATKRRFPSRATTSFPAWARSR